MVPPIIRNLLMKFWGGGTSLRYSIAVCNFGFATNINVDWVSCGFRKSCFSIALALPPLSGLSNNSWNSWSSLLYKFKDTEEIPSLITYHLPIIKHFAKVDMNISHHIS